MITEETSHLQLYCFVCRQFGYHCCHFCVFREWKCCLCTRFQTSEEDPISPSEEHVLEVKLTLRATFSVGHMLDDQQMMSNNLEALPSIKSTSLAVPKQMELA